MQWVRMVCVASGLLFSEGGFHIRALQGRCFGGSRWCVSVQEDSRGFCLQGLFICSRDPCKSVIHVDQAAFHMGRFYPLSPVFPITY